MPDASAFRDLDTIPRAIDEVIWPGLEPAFYQRCRQGLSALTEACKTGSAGKTSFFVGAGISMYRPSRLPNANQVVAGLIDECLRTYPALRRYSVALGPNLVQSEYVFMENILQHLYESVHPAPFHAGRIFDVPPSPPRFNINHEFLARWLRSGSGTVATVNLDPLMEHAWQRVGAGVPRPLIVVRRPEEFKSWNTLTDRPDVLWKLHGSSDDPESWDIILSRVGFSLEDQRADFIRHLISKHNMCFLGYRAADLDIFPPILQAYEHPVGASESFWVFYFHEGYRTLGDYLLREPNVARLFEASGTRMHPIVTTAERLCSWLQSECLRVVPVLPPDDAVTPDYNYRKWFAIDIRAIGEQATWKLIGYTLRVLGRQDEAITVLDEAAEAALSEGEHLADTNELLLQRTAQLLQESAQTSWQQGESLVAIAKVERARSLLRMVGDEVGAEFGIVSMILDTKPPLGWARRLAALARLIRLHWRFWRLGRQSEDGFSAILGQGLCVLYEAKVAEAVVSRTPLLRARPVRLLLAAWYERAGRMIRKSRFLGSVPDVLRRQAFLLAPIEPDKASQMMIEAITIARTLSRAHLDLATERAQLLLGKIGDTGARSSLQQAIDSARSG